MKAYPLALPLGLMSAMALAGPLSGQAQSIDGDSLRVGAAEVRLFGIDAPELSQTCLRNAKPWPCGSEAARQLSALVDGNQLNCASVGTDRHGRTVARCKAGERDVNRTMVALGYALAYRRYSTEYVAAEQSAKLSKRGIWSGSFELPSDVRHGDGDDGDLIRKPEEAPAERAVIAKSSAKPRPSGGCAIKGNQSRRGDKIYHLPGMPYYAETVAEEIFCTESQARAAGYRRSRADRHR